MNDDMAPVFVKIDEYKEVLDMLDVIRKKLGSAKGTLQQIQQLKDEEDRELAAWGVNMEDIEKKVDDINNTIFGKR